MDLRPRPRALLTPPGGTQRGRQSRFAQGTVLGATDSCDDGIGKEQTLVVLRHRRGVVAAATLVAFNLLMFVLAAIGSTPWRLPSWLHGSRAMPP
jgi:hypothetical protein